MRQAIERPPIAVDTPPPAADVETERADPPGGRAAHAYRLVLLAASIALFAYLVWSLGPREIAASFSQLSWRVILVVVFPTIVIKACDTLGWRCTLPDRQVSSWQLARALLAGQAVASTTPTGTLGGDAVKAWMVRHEVSRRASLSSLIIVETTSTVAQGLLLLIGVVLARETLSSSLPLLHVMEWLLVLEVAAVAGFILVQLRGMATRGHGLLNRLGLAAAPHISAAAADVDRALAGFYRVHRRRLAASVAWNLLGWISGALEVWFILYLLHATVSLTLALIIEAFGTSISFATFFLPVQIGVDEGGAVATFLALGLNGATGLSLSLVRRVREVAWIAIGLLVLAGGALPARRPPVGAS